MSEVPPEEAQVPIIEPVPGSPEYIQRYAGLACAEMVNAMTARIEGREGFDPDVYSVDQIVTRQAAILYAQGPKTPDASGTSVAASRDLKVHTHPPTERIEDSREYSYSMGKPWVTVQRGMGFPDANLTGEELQFLQNAVNEVRQMAAADDLKG